MNRLGFLGLLQLADFAVRWRALGTRGREAVIFAGALILLAGFLLIWALFSRPRHRRHSRHHSHHRGPEQDTEVARSSDDESGGLKSRRRKWRRPRRDHRPRNPTLAETGGLPPARTPGPPEPQP